MSDSILNEGFFNNKDIPQSAKLGAIALLLKGTYETYKRGNGNVITFVSKVGANKSVVPIMFDFGDNTSMGNNNALAQAKMLSAGGFNVSAILDGTITDEQVVESTAKNLMDRYLMNSKGLSANCETIISNLRAYFKIWHEKDPNAISPSVAENLINLTSVAYKNANAAKEGSKKKTVAEQTPTEKATNE